MRKLFVVAVLACAACGGSSGGGEGSSGTPTVATPTFSVPGGTKNAPISVAITSTTAGAVIHYTIDGSTPTAASPTYSNALALSTDTTVKAIATAAGHNPSAVATAAYTFQVATPTFSVAGGTYTTPQSIAISTVTPGATIHYTTTGADPTAASPAYAGPVNLSVDPSTTVIKAMATRAGFANSGIASATYTIDSSVTPAAQPTFSPPAPASFVTTQTVTIGSTTAGATIRYTTNGTDPKLGGAQTAASPASVELSATTTLRAVATAPGFTVSAETSGTYTKTGGTGGTFQATCNTPVDLLCDTYVSGWAADVLADEAAACATDGGTWSTTQACPTAGRVASCTIAFSGVTNMTTYYTGFPFLALAQSLCTDPQIGGTWTTY